MVVPDKLANALGFWAGHPHIVYLWEEIDRAGYIVVEKPKPRPPIRFGLWVVLALLWLSGFFLVDVVFSHAQTEQPHPVRACVSVEQFADAAERYDGHVRIVMLSQDKDVGERAHEYAQITGDYPTTANFALILLFSRGDAMVAFGTTEEGICWVNPLPPPYEIIAQYFKPSA